MSTTPLANTYNRPDIRFVSGKGCTLTTDTGEHYLDMTSGIAVTALGHGSPIIQKAMINASKGLIHTSNLYHTTPPIELARALVNHSFADHAFFCNSGTEAVEAAIKFCRLAQGDKRRTIVYFDNSFHGRTYGSLAATDKESARTPFAPLPEGFTKAPFNDLAALDLINESTAAVIVEPIQGEGGIRLADPIWLKALEKHCKHTGTLLVADEIQCGLGRTGTLWAHQQFDVTPDIMTLAKPLGGGLPIGAVLINNRVAKHLTPGCHGTTFGGGPFVTAVAKTIFDTINNPQFLSDVQIKGQHLRDNLSAIKSPYIESVRGKGLMLGVKLTRDPMAIIELALANRLLLVPAGNHVVRFLPPLNADIADLDDAVSRFKHVIETFQA